MPVDVHPQLKLSPRIDGSRGDTEACHHVTGLESLRRAQERLLAKVQSGRSRPQTTTEQVQEPQQLR